MRLRLRGASVVACLIALLVSREVWAQAFPPTDEWDAGEKGARPWQATPTGATATGPEPHTELRWYGHQNLLADGVGIGLLAVHPALGVGTVVLGSPVVHLVHERPGAAAASLTLRLVVPIAALAVSTKCSQEACLPDPTPALAALALGILVDDLALSWERVPTKAEPATGLRVAPTLAVSPKGGLVGLGGVF